MKGSVSMARRIMLAGASHMMNRACAHRSNIASRALRCCGMAAMPVSLHSLAAICIAALRHAARLLRAHIKHATCCAKASPRGNAPHLAITLYRCLLLLRL